MAGQQPGKRAIQELAEDTPPIGSKGGELPAFLPVFSRHSLSRGQFLQRWEGFAAVVTPKS